MKRSKNLYFQTTVSIRNKDGLLIGDKEEKVTRWATYFEELLNQNLENEESYDEENVEGFNENTYRVKIE